MAALTLTGSGMELVWLHTHLQVLAWRWCGCTHTDRFWHGAGIASHTDMFCLHGAGVAALTPTGSGRHGAGVAALTLTGSGMELVWLHSH